MIFYDSISSGASLSAEKQKKQISNEVCFFCLRIFRVYIFENQL